LEGQVCLNIRMRLWVSCQHMDFNKFMLRM
jgi:hypothetical protein